jgi:hypothetical protein
VLEEVRPYLISDGGNIEVVRVDVATRDVSLPQHHVLIKCNAPSCMAHPCITPTHHDSLKKSRS